MAAAAILLAPAAAEAARPLEVGFAEPRFLARDSFERGLWFDRSVEVGAAWARIGVGWRSIAALRPAEETDPGDPSYSWVGVDRAVRDAAARGVKVILTVTLAPDWAEAPDRPSEVQEGTWRPDPEAFGRFAEALARRYSGHYADPLHPGRVLPRVRHFEPWNEPNLRAFLTPQWEFGEPASPEIYRGLLNAFYERVHAIQPGAVVIAGANSPHGDVPGGDRVRPLTFARSLFCLPETASAPPPDCPERARFDAYSHHPISPLDPPDAGAEEAGDVTIAEMGRLRGLLRRAERRELVLPEGTRELWATEFWWQTRPPQVNPNVPNLRRHARWIQHGLYLLWKQRVRVALLFQIGDNDVGGRWKTGLRFADGTPKPSLRAFDFPFVGERRSRSRVNLWGRAPADGRTKVQKKRPGRGWKRIATRRVEAGEVFRIKRVKLRGKARFRARIGSRTSVAWRQGGRAAKP